MSEIAVGPSLLYAVKQVELSVRWCLDEMVRPAGLTALQFTALSVLHRRDGLTAAELARNSFVRTQTIADLVANLERLELIHRVPDPNDGRRRLIHLTHKGIQLVRGFDEGVADLEARMVRDLGPDQIEALREALDSCRRALAD